MNGGCRSCRTRCRWVLKGGNAYWWFVVADLSAGSWSGYNAAHAGAAGSPVVADCHLSMSAAATIPNSSHNPSSPAANARTVNSTPRELDVHHQ